MVEIKSAIYECEVMHHRLSPKVHHFEYRLFYLWLDLDELDSLSHQLKLFKRNRASLFSFFDTDHISLGQKDVRANLLAILEKDGKDISTVHRIRLLTFPRVLGYVFNPVCFYYCFDADDRPLYAVAEVTNTFHEQKPYVADQQDGQGFRLITPKHFYVSPFFDLELNFDFKLPVPNEKLNIHIDDRRGDERVILTALKGKRRELTDSALLSCAVRYPLLTLRVMFLIHWHALRLWIKGLKVYRKAACPELQTGLYRPHQSIASVKP
ncbi:hypothetical protein SAMN02745166_03054 [Prosthecobacter debontii]|uniref:DUF1365 domain-containing protein n=1 Tax=Prosthecobacter debontii TaxID=48467 RepID=A0A1T4YE09_9BACT|nr:DUF1365 domain-containing protein [Prosthecobacter debontii]SKB00062.1 hypothetical protein SAMN02745166_03054 [Prosthecobacter debontii]